MEYKGVISGTGNKDTRFNEITADDLANLRNFICQHDVGILKSDNHDFNAQIDEDNLFQLHISDGMSLAYGYFGYAEKNTITFLPPAVEQYQLVYVEFDKSVIPNLFTVKTKNNMSNPYITDNTFRQDQLSTVKTGICQIPLWQVYITNKGIELLKDIRPIVEYINNVVYSDTTKNIVTNGFIGDNVICPTQDITDNSTKIANTAFVDSAIKSEINR